ncbi:MAG: hypothetical protein MSA25_00900 [Clostridiales bacterium]|nr:hypothetical protein [Clostridiales bacterium]
MLNREELFAAIGEIDDELVLPVLERLEEERERPRLRVTRKAVRVALIAAAIAALLAVTAAASGVLGLKSRLVPAETPAETADPRLPERRDHISLNGLAGSDEYLACSEWLSFCDYYEEQMARECLAAGKEAEAWKDSFHSFAGNQAEKDICRIYGAWDETMFKRLLEISDRYDLRLLTDITYAPSQSYLFETTGLSPYIRGVEHYDYNLGSFLFEDGSFKDESTLSVNGEQYAYTLTCIHAGVLYPFSLDIPAGAQCREWEHISPEGITLDMALFDNEGINDLKIFCNSDDMYVTLSLRWSGGTAEEAYARAELLADCFDFAVLCGE